MNRLLQLVLLAALAASLFLGWQLVHSAEPLIPPFPHSPTITRYTGWELSRVYPGWSFEYREGKCVGAAHRESCQRFVLDPQNLLWLPSAPPMRVIDGPEPLPVRNEGVERDKMTPGTAPVYRLFDGKFHDLTREETLKILGSSDSDRLPSDKDKPWLVAIGPPEFLKQVSADLEAAQTLKNRVRYQGFAPDQWRTKRPDLADLQNSPQFQRTQRALLIATQDGLCVHGQFDYNPGDLQVLGQKFDPARLPDLRLPERVGESIVDRFFQKIKEEPILWLAGGAILVLLLRRPESK